MSALACITKRAKGLSELTASRAHSAGSSSVCVHVYQYVCICVRGKRKYVFVQVWTRMPACVCVFASSYLGSICWHLCFTEITSQLPLQCRARIEIVRLSVAAKQAKAANLVEHRGVSICGSFKNVAVTAIRQAFMKNACVYTECVCVGRWVFRVEGLVFNVWSVGCRAWVLCEKAMFKLA